MHTSKLKSLFHSAREPLEPVREGIRKRPLVLGEGLQADEIFFEERVATSAHAHPREQAAYTVSGEFEVTLNGSLHVVRAGDAYRIPAGAPHAVHCLRAGSYVLITALGDAQDDHNHDHDHGHDHGHSH